MHLEHYSEIKLKSEILGIVGEYLDLKKFRIFFFGSRVTNGHSDRSDIDIGIEGLGEIPGEIMAEIREDMDQLPTLYRFDIVDFGAVTEEFREAASRHREYVN